MKRNVQAIDESIEAPSRDQLRSTWVLVIALVVLPIVAELKFRTRSAFAALEGAADAQVIAEVGIWLVGASLALSVFWPTIRRLPAPAPGAGRYVTMLCGLVALGVAISFPGLVEFVRGLQTIAVLLVVLVVLHALRHLSRLFLAKATVVLVATVLLSAALTAVLGFDFLPAPSYFGIQRFTFFEMHPIATANLLAITGVLLLWILLSHDYVLGRRQQNAAVILLVVFTVAIALTRSRGAIVGYLAAVTSLLAINARWMADRIARAVRLSLIGAGIVLVTLSGTIANYALRGESVDSILSLNNRSELLAATLNVWSESFWVGFGHLAGRSVLLERFAWAGESHNLLSEALLSYGIVGLGVLVVGVTGFFVRFFRLNRREPQRASFFLALFLVLVGQAIVGDSFLGTPGIELMTLVLLILVGWGGPIGSQSNPLLRPSLGANSQYGPGSAST